MVELPLLNYSTTVPVNRTVSEIQAILARAGAATVATEYEDGRPCGVSFLLRTPHGERHFVMPVDVPAVHRLLVGQRGKGVRPTQATPEHAARVAWRITKDWLEAQIALIEAQLATLDQVMLPYLRTPIGKTVYELYREQEQSVLALEAGS